MSRGGRGGGAARGGGGSRLKIGGVEISWDLSGLDVKSTPQELFPDIPPPQAPPPTLHEKICCQRYCALRDRIHEGPLYTVLDDNVKTVKKRKERGSPPPEPGAVMDPFTGTETYSSRYMKKKKTMPKLDARPYVLHLFPENLRPLLDPTLKSGGAQTNGAANAGKPRKLFDVTKNTMKTKLERIEAEEQERLRRGGDEDEDLDEGDDEGKENEEEEEGNPDDDDLSRVSSDSEDEDDDYNAEKYFDGGDDDDYGGDEGHDENYYE